VPAHLVLGADPLGEPFGDLSLAIFALAVPRLADAECGDAQLELAHGRSAQQITTSTSRANSGPWGSQMLSSQALMWGSAVVPFVYDDAASCWPLLQRCHDSRRSVPTWEHPGLTLCRRVVPKMFP